MDTGGEQHLRHLGPRAATASVLLLVAMLVLGWRLWELQVHRGPAYAALAGRESLRTVALPAVRGEILDRNGVVLARDISSWTATLSYTPNPPSSAEAGLLSQILGITPTAVQAAALRLRTGQPFVPVVLASHLTARQSTLISQDAWELPGVSLVAEPQRTYPGLPGAPDPGPDLAANLLGTVRAGTLPGDLVGANGIEGTYNSLRVAPGLTVGLAGTDGQEIVQVDQQYHPLRVLAVSPPVPGDNVTLTINAKLQAVAQRALTDQLAALRQRTFGSDGGPFPLAATGAAVVIDVRNGQILAAASEPGFDPNAFASAASAPPGSAAAQAFAAQYAAWLQEPGRPLVDHDLSDAVPPGSTFKPVTAIAALQAGVITAGQHLGCPASISLGNGYVLHNWIPVWDGSLDLIQALAFSCDTYFYTVGQNVGIGAIDRVASEFGLGQPTGQQDIAGEENPGTLSSPTMAQRAGQPWTPALTMQTAIGQGFSAFNPLEIAAYTAALANGGTLWRPYFVSQVTSATGQVLWQQKPKVRRHIPLSPAIQAAITAGMAAVTQNHPSWSIYGPVDTFGTAYYPFYGFTAETAQYLGQAITVAGKTGTAQLGNGIPSDGWFISFAPASNPQIAVVVYTDHSNEGFVGGAPVAREIYNYYFGLDRAMWKAGQEAQIIPPSVQMYFGQNSPVPPWFGPEPQPASSRTATQPGAATAVQAPPRQAASMATSATRPAAPSTTAPAKTTPSTQPASGTTASPARGAAPPLGRSSTPPAPTGASASLAGG